MKKQVKTRKLQRARTTANESDGESLSVWISELFKALLIALASGVLLLLVGTTALYFTPDPNKFLHPLSLVISAVTALIGGFAAGKLHGHAALLCGLFEGSLLMALFLLVSLFFKNDAKGYSALLSCALHIGFLLVAVVGASLGTRPSKKRKRK